MKIDIYKKGKKLLHTDAVKLVEKDKTKNQKKTKNAKTKQEEDQESIIESNTIERSKGVVKD